MTLVAALLLFHASTGYAPLIRNAAQVAHVDPLVFVALVEHESRFRVDASNGRCFGLGQVCDARAAESDVARRAELFDGPTNLRIVGQYLAGWRRYCRRVTGHAEVVHVLSGYAGTDRPGIVCGQKHTRRGWITIRPHRVVREIIAIWRKIK